MILIHNKEEKRLLEAFRSFVNSDDYAKKLKEVMDLKGEVEELKISKSRLQEEHDKEERELRHMIGLEKKRQEFEIEAAKSRASLDVREENLKMTQARFTEQLQFNTDRFEKAAADQKELLGEIIKRLPNVNMKIAG